MLLRSKQLVAKGTSKISLSSVIVGDVTTEMVAPIVLLFALLAWVLFFFPVRVGNVNFYVAFSAEPFFAQAAGEIFHFEVNCRNVTIPVALVGKLFVAHFAGHCFLSLVAGCAMLVQVMLEKVGNVAIRTDSLLFVPVNFRDVVFDFVEARKSLEANGTICVPNWVVVIAVHFLAPCVVIGPSANRRLKQSRVRHLYL